MYAVVIAIILGLCARTNALCEETTRPPLNFDDLTTAGILQLLHDGEEQIEREIKVQDAIAFVGNSGSGMTTLALHISGNDDDLTSVKTKTRGIFIEDKCKRICTGIKTCTLIPNQLIDRDTQTTYLDMPSFGGRSIDSVAFEIGLAYFTKKALDNARRVKLVFVVEYNSFYNFRWLFKPIAEKAVQLVRNISKFEEGIALVVTKVTNYSYYYEDDKKQYLSNEDVAYNIAEFLKEFRSFYVTENRMDIVQWIDVFLKKDANGEYNRIGIFRKPDTEGPLKNIKLLQEMKPKLKEVLLTNIKYIEKNNSDLGYTLSKKFAHEKDCPISK